MKKGNEENGKKMNQKPVLAGGKRLFSLIGFPLFIAAIFAVFFVFREPLFALFKDPQTVREWIMNQGAAAPFVFIGIQIVQVVLFVIPGEIPQIAGGYLFGTMLGGLYSLIGITLGSAFNFQAGRLLGKPFVVSLVGETRVEQFTAILSSPKAMLGFFLLFLVPGLPKDALCYIAGFSPLGFFPFLVVFVGGRIPAIITSAYMGSAAAEERWIIVIVLTIVVVIGLVVIYTFKQKILTWIERVSHRLRRKGAESPKESKNNE